MILARQKHLQMILASNFPLWDFFGENTCSECCFFLLFCYFAVLSHLFIPLIPVSSSENRRILVSFPRSCLSSSRVSQS